MGLFNGKVVIVTGAGGGLGRAHALAFAKEGASVVVNDLGGSRDGSGTGGNSMAEKVCAEIKALGGKACPNFDSVSTAEGAERIIQTAIKNFGRLDVLVNNAGILRDKTLLKMTDEEWKPVISVHLDGTFYCGRAAAKYFADNKVAGRIVNTTSLSGIRGNYGQCNYGAAKAGVVALTRIWAMELSKFGVTVNAIAPMAKTRMTEDIEAVPDDTQPKHIAPLVVFLASELASDVTGRIFGAHGRHYFEYKNDITEGVKPEEDWTPSEIKSKLDAISASASATASSSASATATSGGGGLKERIAKAFGLMEIAFTADKAAGWTANIQFTIEGADNYTLDIKDKKCVVKKGIEGNPTCKVNTNADTMAGMIEGKISGQSAFMSGKIKASSLGDMMKFGKVFDFKRAREVAAKGGAPASSGATASASSSVSLDGLFSKLQTLFVPDAVTGWNGKVVFAATGGDAFTIAIENKICQITKTNTPGAVCTITGQASDIAAVLTGQSDFKSAITTGKLKASNPMALVKMHGAFKWKEMAGTTPNTENRTVSDSGSDSASAGSGGVNSNIVGRKYRTPAMFVRPDKIREYASATSDPNAIYTRKGNDKDLLASPIFPVTLLGDLFKQMLADDTGIDLARMVHGEQSIQYFDVLRPWDLISPRGVISKVEKRGNNDVVSFEQSLYRDGELVVKMTSNLVVKGSGGSKSASEEKKPGAGATAAGKPAFTHTVKVDTDQARRYANASGDHNPIHLDNDVAKAAGLPGVILHGLCTMAFAGQAVVEKVLNGDIRRLKELSVRFSKPVLPGDTLTFTGEISEKNAISLNAVNASGIPVLTQGVAKFDREAGKT